MNELAVAVRLREDRRRRKSALEMLRVNSAKCGCVRCIETVEACRMALSRFAQ